MDDILRQVGLDMKFTIYNLIAMTKDDGLLQFVSHSMTIYDIIHKEDKTIENYLRRHAKSEDEY